MRLRAQRRAVRARLEQLRRESRARVDALPAIQAARKKRARRRTLASAVLLLLLLFLRCDCEPAPQPEPTATVPAGLDAGSKLPPSKPTKRLASNERLASSARRGYELGAGRSPAWLDDFRMQVAARSPRLALCFQGADRPGALRWSVALNPESGAVSDHLFEPIGAADLTTAQRDCVQKVVSSPVYRVAEADRQSVPGRVSLVIEF